MPRRSITKAIACFAGVAALTLTYAPAALAAPETAATPETAQTAETAETTETPAALAAPDAGAVKITEWAYNGSEFVEFTNLGDSPVDLNGWSFSDSNAQAGDVALGAAGSIAPGESFILSEVPAADFRAEWNLPETVKVVGGNQQNLGRADAIHLYDANGELVDALAYGDNSIGGPRTDQNSAWPSDEALGNNDVTGWTLSSPGDIEQSWASVSGHHGSPGQSRFASGTGENPTPASAVVLNEIVYDDAATGTADSVELFNTGTEAIDLSNWAITDDKQLERTVRFAAGRTIAAGEFLVVETENELGFGLGKGDTVYLYDAENNIVDSYAYENTAPLADWSRCIDGTGGWAPATAVTLGAPNSCDAAPVAGTVVLNEVDSQPADWVELYNPGTLALDLSGYELRDNSDDHRWQFAAGTTIEGGAFLIVDENSLGTSGGAAVLFPAVIGIGSADEIRLFDTTGKLIDRTGTWSEHAALNGDASLATLARCIDGDTNQPFKLAHPTLGAANSCVMPNVKVNEVDSSADFIEIINLEPAAVDLSGWSVMDNDPIGHAADTTSLPQGTELAPGERFVFEVNKHFIFGLGNGDTATLRDEAGLVVDSYSYAAHAVGSWQACPEGGDDFIDATPTKGSPNACGIPVRINEVESSGGTPGDWVELVNASNETIDLGGLVIRDNKDSNEYVIPAGTELAGGAFAVIDEEDLGFGLGSDDSVRLFENDQLIDSTSWGPEHAAVTWGRCPDVVGAFGATVSSTKGAANVCSIELDFGVWPGAEETQLVDTSAMFLEDSSGLDTQHTADGDFLWAVDNGEGRFWKLNASADGSATFVDGWQNGKRIRFSKDAANPSAAGPDTEGISVDGDGMLYFASERDNSAKGVNWNVILQGDPNAEGPDVIASQEWDLTHLLPPVSANLGIEAVEWVADADVADRLIDQNTSAPYVPASYPNHIASGVFFVAVEDGGHVFAFALNTDSSAELIAEIDPGLGGVMALDYDTVRGGLWAVCDDGCDGASAFIVFDGGASQTSLATAAASTDFSVSHFARAAGLPNTNNEGFATWQGATAGATQRPVWWFTDGVRPGALHSGFLGISSAGEEDPGSQGPGSQNPGGQTPGEKNGDPLANTGAEDPTALGLLAMLVVAAGAMLVMSRRRKDA